MSTRQLMSTGLNDHPGVVETSIVHDVHRRATSLLVAALGTPSAPIRLIADLRDFVTAMLDHHHTSEDTDLWPLLNSAEPALTRGLSSLTDEHEHLERQLEVLRRTPLDDESDRARCVPIALALRDLVVDHLAHEEPILFPALRRSISDIAWSEFSARTVASSPQEGVHLLVAMLHEAGTPDELEIIFRHLPPLARQLLPAKLAAGREAIATLESDDAHSAAGRADGRNPWSTT